MLFRTQFPIVSTRVHCGFRFSLLSTRTPRIFIIRWQKSLIVHVMWVFTFLPEEQDSRINDSGIKLPVWSLQLKKTHFWGCDWDTVNKINLNLHFPYLYFLLLSHGIWYFTLVPHPFHFFIFLVLKDVHRKKMHLGIHFQDFTFPVHSANKNWSSNE